MAIVLYDGECGMCRASVQFVLNRDREGVFRFASLQSKAGREILRGHGIGEVKLDTMYLSVGDEIFERSTAVLRICSQLPYYRSAAGAGLLVPRFFRDWIYDVIARNRHRIGGSKSCPSLTDEQRARFLDLPE